MLLFFIGILLIVSRSQSSLCSLLPQNNLLNKKSKIIINQFIEVTLSNNLGAKLLQFLYIYKFLSINSWFFKQYGKKKSA